MLQLYSSKKIFDTNLIGTIAFSQNLNDAFNIVYKNRKKYHYNSEIWHLSSNWNINRVAVQVYRLIGNGGFKKDTITDYKIMLLTKKQQ